MTPRYTHALDNIERLLRYYKPMMHEQDIKQLQEDIFYLKLYQRYVQVPKTSEGSK